MTWKPNWIPESIEFTYRSAVWYSTNTRQWLYPRQWAI